VTTIATDLVPARLRHLGQGFPEDEPADTRGGPLMTTIDVGEGVDQGPGGGGA